MSAIVIRAARAEDVSALTIIEQEAWPAGMNASAEQIRARIAAFPRGQLVAVLHDEVVGVVWSQRVTPAQIFGKDVTYAQLTDHGCFTASHRDAGEVFQLIGVAVGTAGRKLRLGRQLVDAEIALARTLPGVTRILGFTRPRGFQHFAAQHPGATIEQYVVERSENGRPHDPLLAFHLTAGARLVSVQAQFRPEDDESHGYGALIEYAC